LSLEGKRILITGGTGSVGISLLSELVKCEPKVIRVFSNDENGLVTLENEYSSFSNIRCLLGDVYDFPRLVKAVEGVDVIFHLAALKHVKICEYNPFEAVKTNVLGTQNIVEAAIREDVGKVIFTSSDKAANSVNVLGATKLLAEKLITSANYYKGPRRTVFSSVRFGNLVGSRGSIVPLVNMQIKKGRRVYLTDRNMSRFVMSMDEAVKLLLKVQDIMQGGEVFIFKMPSVMVVDFIEEIVKINANKFGCKPSDVKIETSGVGPGEKIHEELMSEEETKNSRALELEDFYVLLPDLSELKRPLLKHYVEKMDAKKARVKPYTSRDAERLSREDMRKLIQPAC